MHILVVYFSMLFTVLDGYNVLVYSPSFGNSHSYFMGKLADTLTDSGHNVTLLVPVMDVTRRNITGVKTTKDVVFVDQDEIARQNFGSIQGGMPDFWLSSYRAEDYDESSKVFQQYFVETCANLMRNTQVFEQMQSRHFDVVLSEPLSICGVGFAHRLGITKMIQTSSCTFYDFMNSYIGEPDEHSYVPSEIGQTSDKMDFFERYENFKTTFYMRRSIDAFFDREEQVYSDNHQLKMPSWQDLLASSSMHFTNANPYLDFPRATIQKTVLIGGISVDMDDIRSQKISEEWNRILDERSKTMLISFGSMTRSADMPTVYRETLLRVIKSFPDVTFIWKYESDDTNWAAHVTNIHFSKWTPQTALLNDKRVTAFLTHGGLGSTNELAYCGKPALMVPIAWDQTRNSKMYSRLGAALTIKKTDLANFDLLRTSIHTILYDDNYTRNAQRIAEMLDNQPVKPKELVVKYTEFVARFGPFPNMDPYVRHMNFIQKTGLDVLAIFHLRSIVVFVCVLIGLKLVFVSLRDFMNKRKLD